MAIPMPTLRTIAAVEAGYTHVTHMYSGMEGVEGSTAKRAGTVEAALLLDD